MSTGKAANLSDGIADAVLRWFSQNSTQGVLLTDTELTIVGWNKWLVTATGLTADAVIGHPLFEVVPSLLERGFDQYFQQALHGQVKVLSHSFHRYIVPTLASPSRPVAQMAQSGQIGPLGAAADIVGTITVIDDVSDRVASETRLRERIASAEAASRVKDEFLATLSHEIRTPLNAVLGWTRILRSRPDIDESTLRRAIDVIDRNAAAQLRLVTDMLDMARIASGKVKLEMSEVDLGSLVGAAIEAARPAADVKGVRVSVDVESARPMVSGDADRLLQVIWNLISNAVKFTDAGGDVALRVADDGRNVLLTISDTGQGIEPAFLPHVFERFKQADASSSRRHGGLGLGLALVKDLVQLHGGTVSVESGGPRAGATFRVRLPVRGIPSSKHVAGSAPVSSGGALRNIRVLVVEDDPDAAEIVSRALHDAAGDVRVAGSVDEAMTMIRDSGDPHPHVIVTDIGLPARDGYGFIEGLRSLPRELGGAIPMIALTAYASSDDRAKALRAGFAAHIAKPCDPETLVALVAQAAGV